MRDPLEKAAGNFPRWKKVCFWKLRLRTGGRKSESEGEVSSSIVSRRVAINRKEKLTFSNSSVDPDEHLIFVPVDSKGAGEREYGRDASSQWEMKRRSVLPLSTLHPSSEEQK